MGIAHEQSAQLRAKGSRMELMVLSVEHIRAFGLESDVLPAHTIFVAAIVARFEVGGDRCTSISQPCKLAAEPHCLSIDFRKPPAMAVMGPQQIRRIFESSLQTRLPTHLHALVQGHCSQLTKDPGHVDVSTALLWSHALHQKLGIPALLLGCPSGRAAAFIVSTHLAAPERR